MAHRAYAQWSVSTPTPTGQRKRDFSWGIIVGVSSFIFWSTVLWCQDSFLCMTETAKVRPHLHSLRLSCAFITALAFICSHVFPQRWRKSADLQLKMCRWNSCAPMAKRRGGVGVATWHGFLYAIGGHDAPASSLSSRLSDCVERWVDAWYTDQQQKGQKTPDQWSNCGCLIMVLILRGDFQSGSFA